LGTAKVNSGVWTPKKSTDGTLNDKLSASGTFALTGSAGSSGVFFGWFDGDQAGGRETSLAHDPQMLRNVVLGRVQPLGDFGDTQRFFEQKT